MIQSRTRGALFVLLAWSLACPVLAHDGKHTGSSVQGIVVSMTGDTVVIKAGGSDVSVTLTKKTQIVTSSGAVDRKALVPGARVDVHGSKLPGGGFAAREVVLESAPGAPDGDHDKH